MEKLQIPELRKTAYPVKFDDSEEPAPVMDPFKTAAYEVICGLHLAAGVFMMLFVDMISDLPMLLVAIAYCFLAGTAFGIMASAGGIEEWRSQTL